MANATTNTTTTSTTTRRRGVGLIWSVLILLALCGIASMAVDFGRVTLAKTQLRGAADAAALAAGQLLLSDLPAARLAAVDVAKKNTADGKPVVLDGSADIAFGNWDAKARTFTPANSSQRPNAVKVTARRTAARGNAIDLPFAKMVNVSTCDVTVEVVALAKPQKYAAVGLDFVKMGGNASNGYQKKGQFTEKGSIASNGDITLGGSSFIQGDAFPGVGRRVIGASHVSGSTTPLTQPLVYPQADPGNAANVNDNGRIPQTALASGIIKKGATLSGGTYYVQGIELGAGEKLTFTGPTTLYVAGNIALKGHAVTHNEIPDNLRIVVLGTGRVIDLNGSTALHADIYAPGAAIDIHGTGDIYGSIVGKSISMTGSSAIHYDHTLRGGVTLVK